MENKKIRVAITHGDTNGIGYELIFKTFAAPEILELCTPIIYGSPKIAAYHRKALDIEGNFSIISEAGEAREGRVNLLTCFDDEVKVDLGMPTKESADAAIRALDRAVSDYRQGLYDVLVTAPANEQGLESGGVKFRDQESFIEACLSDNKKGLPMLVNESLRVALATSGIALKDVPGAITADLLENRITLLHDTLRRDYRISSPRIAVLSLNPESGEPGSFGKEEKEIIAPTISKLADQGLSVFGPYAADELFSGNVFDAFDCILAMYHDQGFAPFKALEPTNGVISLAGLPIVCTAPESTANFSIAGRGTADENAFRQAIYLAIDICRHREEYDEPLEQPLKKLYHERHDDGEKVRFSIPKKHENAIRERAPRNGNSKPNAPKDNAQKPQPAGQTPQDNCKNEPPTTE